MASRFWDFVTNLVAGAFARAEHVNAHLEEIDNALLLVANELNRCVRLTSGTPDEADYQLSQTAAQRANKVLGFNSSGNPELKSVTFAWRGDWNEPETYNVNDTVRAPESGDFSVYVCVLAHTSTSDFAADLAAGRWQVMIDLSQLRGAIRSFEIIDDDYTAEAGDDLFVDTTVQPVTITLPASPSLGDQPITICDVGGNASSNQILIERNGHLINGQEADLPITTNRTSLTLAFAGAGLGWQILSSNF